MLGLYIFDGCQNFFKNLEILCHNCTLPQCHYVIESIKNAKKPGLKFVVSGHSPSPKIAAKCSDMQNAFS